MSVRRFSVKMAVAALALLAAAGCSGKDKNGEVDEAAVPATIELQKVSFQRSHELTGSSADYFTDHDLVYTDSVSLLLPGEIYGKKQDGLYNAIVELAFDTVSPDVNQLIAAFVDADVHRFDYPTKPVANVAIQRADGFAMLEGSVVNLTPALLVYQLQSSSYNPAAAHPMSTCYYLNYLLDSDRVLKFDTLFNAAKKSEVVSQISKRAQEMADVIGPTTIDSLPDRDNFYINPQNEIVFVYQPYEVASYAQGMISVSFEPYELLDYLSPFGVSYFGLEDL